MSPSSISDVRRADAPAYVESAQPRHVEAARSPAFEGRAFAMPVSDHADYVAVERSPLRDELAIRIFIAAALAVVIVFSVLTAILEAM